MSGENYLVRMEMVCSLASHTACTSPSNNISRVIVFNPIRKHTLLVLLAFLVIAINESSVSRFDCVYLCAKLN